MFADPDPCSLLLWSESNSEYKTRTLVSLRVFTNACKRNAFQFIYVKVFSLQAYSMYRRFVSADINLGLINDEILT